MPKIPYTKPALTFSDQLQQLKNRGLEVEDDIKAIHLLENISYYRLSAYWYPLLQIPKSSHTFKPESSLEMSFKLYCFDRELRKLVSSELEKIEIAVRAKMIYILSHAHGAFWYRETALFSNNAKFLSTNHKLSQEYSRSKEEFILAFKRNYNDPMPPSWMILEVSSFGALSNLYQNLNPSQEKRAIAQYFGLDVSTFESWLHALAYVRNVCAHHSRLWNKVMRILPSLPITPTNTWLSNTSLTNTRTGAVSSINNRTYCTLSMIIYLLNTINPKNTFKQKIYHLLKKYPNADPRAMGFATSWKTESIWIVNNKSRFALIKDFLKKLFN
jgi:abortive infection bacteriophage resistance protein